MKTTAILACAGIGKRVGLKKNKILYNLDNDSVLLRSVENFYINNNIDKIIVSANAVDFEEVKEICSPFKNCKVITGGQTRTDTIKIALSNCDDDCDIVLIHDGARPFVSQKIINDCVESVKKFGSGICATPSTDTLIEADDDEIKNCIPREKIYSLQTPQGFIFKDIVYAYDMIKCNDVFTDDSSVFAKYVKPPHFFIGEKENIKITYEKDLENNNLFVGVGVDTHAFGSDKDYIILGGEKIPHTTGIIAHSDGDVLIHAIMDAMLSASGLNDIGFYFPDTDQKFKDISSVVLLQEVTKLINDKNMFVKNVSCAIVTEKPKLKDYITKMKQNLSEVLNIEPCHIGITAGTNEKLGYIGRGEGITVNCIATLYKKQF